ncbi:hypothetical protein B0A49_09886 [Cryomyces minteri]|uniref:Transcription initiation factor TFIID subunit 10 n=1 Tax=Cryomyces minteri TaxID=331657 RepID=A0A4U0WHX7_9PEZI|nr:hypothetical protein B0A49_09886 [Cryomyces minteri]
MSDAEKNPADQDPLQTETVEDEIDPSIDAEMKPSAEESTQTPPANLDGALDTALDHDMVDTAHAPEPRTPAKKDASLREFLGKMDDYAPIVCISLDHKTTTDKEYLANARMMLQIPDAVTNYYLTLAGLPPPPQTSPQLARLLALATQKFIADIAADAYQYSRIRSSNTTSNNPMGGLGGVAGMGTMAGAQGAPGGAQGGKDQGKGGAHLGQPRPGFGGGGPGGAQGRTVLTMEDLGMAVGEYGVNVKRGEFYR